MSPETRAFLDAVRTAEDPTTEDERRVLSAVRAAIATGAVAGAGLGVSKAAKLFGGGAAAGVKVGGLALGLSAAAWIAATALPPQRPAFPTAAVALPAPSSPPGQKDRPPTLPEVPDTTSAARRHGPANAVRSPTPARTPSASPPYAASSLRGELALLAEVQAALARGDGATALRKLDERPSTDRRLLAERRAARILALCSLGRAAEAARSASAFFREHPSSVQRRAVERSCAGKGNEPR